MFKQMEVIVMKSKVLSVVKDSLLLFAAAFCYSYAMYVFVMKNNFTNGGVAGIVVLITHFMSQEAADAYTGIMNFALNAPLIIMAFIVLSKGYTIKTTACIVMISLMLEVFPKLDFITQYSSVVTVNGIEYEDVGRSILGAIFGGALCGVAIYCVIGARGSTGGADIVAAFIQKKNPACNVQWGIFIVNCVIIAASVIVYSYDVANNTFVFDADSFQPVMLAFIFQFISAKVCDILTQGPKTALKFEVITEHPEELSKELMESLNHGVTLLPAKGMFEHKEKSLLICLVKKRQIQDFKDILKKYPGTFAYVASVNEIIGMFNQK